VRFSAPIHTCPVAHPASYTRGARSFQGVKRPGHGVNHLPPPNTERRAVFPLWALMAHSRVNFTFTFKLICLTEYYAREQNLLIIELENYNLSANFSSKNYAGGDVFYIHWIIFEN